MNLINADTELLTGILFLVLGYILPSTLYLLTLHNTLKNIQLFNRRMTYTTIWLMLIPLFNFFWQFVVYSRMNESLSAEYFSRNIHENTDSSYKTGLISGLLGIITIIINQFVQHSPFVTVTYFLCYVGWIAYWIQIGKHKKRLQSLPLDQFKDSEIFGHVERP
jgi:glucose-6-phosphate-specific signal transduction histidine kinase